MSKSDILMEIIRGRRSIRRFHGEPIEPDKLTALIEAAAWAPSASNRQDWFFTIVTSSEIKRQMADAVKKRWKAIVENNPDLGFVKEVESYSATFADFADAPVVIVVSAMSVNAVQKHLLSDEAHVTAGSATSAAMAAQNLMLAAHALGLGTCCMTGALAAREELARILKLSRKREIVCLVAVGRPVEIPTPPSRKPIEEIRSIIE
jgi:nitroreductase